MLIKSAKKIATIKECCEKTAVILDTLAGMCKPGVSTGEIDAMAEKLIREAGGRPAFKGYRTSVADRPFPATICASLNEEVVHGIPRAETILKDGDLFTIDIGMEWPNTKSKPGKGGYSDTAVTVAVGKIPPKAEELLRVTQEALEAGIRAAQPGNSVAAIGQAIEAYVKSQGRYGIIRDLVGHGVGETVHEEPMVPNYYDPTLESIKLEPGMVIAIEPMISLGGWRVETMNDGWTIKTADDSLSAHFEHTIIITETGNIVASRRPSEQ